MSKLGNNAPKTKTLLNFFGTLFSEVGKLGNIMFPHQQGRGYTSVIHNNTVNKVIFGCSYKSDKYDLSFLFRDGIICVMEV